MLRGPASHYLILKGKASGKIWSWAISAKVIPQQTLLEFFIEKKIPIASSCSGLGQCALCLVGDETSGSQRLSCQISLADIFLQKSSVILYKRPVFTTSYL